MRSSHYTVRTPGLLQKNVKKGCNNPGIFPGLVVFSGVFFGKFAKNRKKIFFWKWWFPGLQSGYISWADQKLPTTVFLVQRWSVLKTGLSTIYLF